MTEKLLPCLNAACEPGHVERVVGMTTAVKCVYCGLTAPYKVWQSLPRCSGAVAGVIEDMGELSARQREEKNDWLADEIDELVSRLSTIAEPVEVLGEVWVVASPMHEVYVSVDPEHAKIESARMNLAGRYVKKMKCRVHGASRPEPDACHICHRLLSGPGESYCSAFHGAPQPEQETPNLCESCESTQQCISMATDVRACRQYVGRFNGRSKRDEPKETMEVCPRYSNMTIANMAERDCDGCTERVNCGKSGDPLDALAKVREAVGETPTPFQSAVLEYLDCLESERVYTRQAPRADDE